MSEDASLAAPACPPQDSELQRQIDELMKEREMWKVAVADAVPVMDTSVNDSDLEPPLEENRFAALRDHDSGSAAQGVPNAETVLVFDPPAEGEVGGQESEADTESLPGAASEVETVEVPEHVKWEESSRVTKDPFAESRRLLVVMESPSSLDIRKKGWKRKWKSRKK